MKKFVSVLVIVLGAIFSACAGDLVTRDISRLPESARQSLRTHFPKNNISYIKIDKEVLKKDKYEAILTDGSKVEFDSNGNWTEVDCNRKAVPATYIPAKIQAYLKANFPTQKVTKIERNRRKYELKLDNGLDAKFDLEGNLLKLDD